MKKNKIITFILIIICLFIFIKFFSNLISSSDKLSNKNIVSQVSDSNITKVENNTPKEDPFKNAYEYEVVHELSNIRFDGGNNYYVLIDPIDLSNDNFKDRIKATMKKIAHEQGGYKVSIDIFDNSKMLDLYYESHYVLNILDRTLTKSEIDQLSTHLIASYDKNLSTGLYKNELDFFPATSKSNAVVGKYVEILEFN